MSTSGGTSGGAASAWTAYGGSKNTSGTLVANTTTHVSATTTQTLPAQPGAGTTCIVKNTGTTTQLVSIAAGAGDTIEGYSGTATTLAAGQTGVYFYTGTQWDVIDADPPGLTFSAQLAVGGTSFPAATNAYEQTFIVPWRQKTTNRVVVAASSPAPLLLSSGAANGVYPIFAFPSFTSGTVTLHEIDYYVYNYNASQYLWLQWFPSGGTGQLVGPFASTLWYPGTGAPLLNSGSWTTAKSAGSDLTLTDNSGLTVDSTAGGAYNVSLYYNVSFSGVLP